ncbi:MAG: transcription elongation factor GreA [Rhodospirillaceae bacterium]|nr:transcription elongation factor GreA [Rhodospirillaceae bacterium]
MDKVPMTLEGFQRLESELKRLKTKERPDVIKAIATAREHGDLSENAEYHAAKERQGFIEGRLNEIEEKIANSEVIDPSQFSGNTIKFGATVTVADEDTDEEITYQIVGEHEASIETGFLSFSAPLARAMIGKAVGDMIEVNTPKGAKGYEILKVVFK